MRLLFLVAAGVLSVSSCLDQGAGSSSTGGSGGGEPGGACDGKNDCGTCSTCAAQVACAAELDACVQNSACQAIDQCFSLCGADQACRQQCYAGNPEGVSTYEAATVCVYCVECALDCAGYRPCS